MGYPFPFNINFFFGTVILENDRQSVDLNYQWHAFSLYPYLTSISYVVLVLVLLSLIFLLFLDTTSICITIKVKNTLTTPFLGHVTAYLSTFENFHVS